MTDKPKTVGSQLSDHKNAVLKVKFGYDENDLVSCGAQDARTSKGELFLWDLHSFQRVR
jgi:hypothetical protein